MALLLESEKNQGYYFAFDTKELTRGSQLERYQAYEIALRNRFLQVDEVRKEEDYDPMGFNFITLGLGDVLLNHETKQVAMRLFQIKIQIPLFQDKKSIDKALRSMKKGRIN